MEPGSILAGRYRVGEPLGRGGMGIVFEATHIHLGTQVAVKMLRKEAVEEPDLVERFLREARAAARLKGEHICRVTDFGTTDDGIPFMVMELLDGEDLREMLDRGPLEVSLIATYIAQACIGVAEAHALGMIHRDLKPGNLMAIRRPDGRRSIKLLDFGIAKSTSTFDKSLTATSKAMGSPAYMSPEQLRASTTIDHRADIWSLGVTMYELVTDRRPWDGDTPYELALSIANDPYAPIPDTVPAEFAKIIKRCLEKDREDRYRDVAELATALAPLAKNGKEIAAEVKAALIPPSAGGTGSRDRIDTPQPMTETTMRGASGVLESRSRRTRTLIAIPLLLVGLIAIGAGGYMFYTRGDGQPASAPKVDPPPPPPVIVDAPAPVAVDAAEPVVDAAELPDAATVIPDAAPEKPVKKPPRIRKDPTKNTNKKCPPDDLGCSWN